MFSTLTFLAVLLTLSTAASLTVHTRNGLITGHTSPNTSSVAEFLGIPFTQSPTGKLRFQSPQHLSGGTRHYIAANYSVDCPDSPNGDVHFPDFTLQAQQVIDYFSANSGTTQGEDCLSLNIWTPENGDEVACADRPVLIFFYGGRFTFGHTDTPVFDGARLAGAEDVVVVTVNYRDNIFGFPGLGAGRNAGLLDQRLAVEWLRVNVAGFGGDPALMTIFGQSAGGVSVDYWAYAYSEDPIVAGLISESGNAKSFPLNTENTTLSNWYNVTETLGCGNTSASLACMQTKNWTDIKAAAAKAPSASSGNPLRSVPAFYPSADNKTVFSNYTALSEQGGFAILPYLLGNNNFEQGYYALPSFKKNVTVTISQGDSFLLNSFTCPSQYQAAARAAHGVPVWLCRYFGNWPNLELYPANSDYPGQVVSEGSGAYHGSDLEMVFGNSAAVSGIPDSSDEDRMIKLMQGAWAAFARDPARGLTRRCLGSIDDMNATQKD
ncbi:hypothetical protein LTR62_008760 [Meristemomyces frigidus]|uniref:Carboxylic ester hydrolase n=1 Tax=Meristemomyces frigidus TaxID=1508187 RepID=A0AAN7YCI1_9PEZI|nr:hypothetical protein LTR62_008760 [Meristemomyces frigidus]